MSVENIFNNPEAKAKKAALAKTFNAAILALNSLEMEGTDEWLKAIKTEYVKRRTELDNASVDLEAAIDVAPKTRAKRKSKEETTSTATATTTGETKVLTAKEKAAAAKAAKEGAKKDDLD